MYRRFRSIGEAYQKLRDELQRRGKLRFNKRTNKMTKELIGVVFRAPIDFFMDYYEDRPENVELETAFDEALKIIFRDETARYALGTPQVSLNKDRSPCLIAVQILIPAGKPIVVVYFRSQNIELLPADFAAVARKTFITFGRGEIVWIMGSLHLEMPGM
jgi:curved DNA-binding protein CbpA